jgi:hypothetical protein
MLQLGRGVIGAAPAQPLLLNVNNGRDCCTKG